MNKEFFNQKTQEFLKIIKILNSSNEQQNNVEIYKMVSLKLFPLHFLYKKHSFRFNSNAYEKVKKRENNLKWIIIIVRNNSTEIKTKYVDYEFVCRLLYDDGLLCFAFMFKLFFGVGWWRWRMWNEKRRDELKWKKIFFNLILIIWIWGLRQQQREKWRIFPIKFIFPIIWIFFPSTIVLLGWRGMRNFLLNFSRWVWKLIFFLFISLEKRVNLRCQRCKKNGWKNVQKYFPSNPHVFC